jgi:protein ImuB
MKAEMQVQEIFSVLHKWGIHTLGQLAALNKEDLRSRLGSQAVQLWERANGTATRPLKLVRPPESFEESFEFENEIETAEPLLFMLRRFLEQLALRLGAIYVVAKELTLCITFANKQRYERIFKIPQPTNDVDLLFRMLQTHLGNFRSEHPIAAVALSAQPIRPVLQQFGLFETALRNPQQLYETLARLIAVLGADRVGTPVLDETHRPDAFHMEPFSWHGLPTHIGRMPMPWIALRRYRSALPASVLLDEDRPVHVRSGEVQGNVIEHRGPYLLSGNWWDEKAWVRAEYDMQLENGQLVRAHATGDTWKLDGIYD